jgi:L-seryl-tRNA(Ser) seleniumtransferase
MVKTSAEASHSALRDIPSVERILSSPGFTPLIEEFGRGNVKDAVVEHLGGLRVARAPFDETAALGSIRVLLETATATTLRRVINGSGVIIHTNLGRSPIDPAVWAEAQEIVTGYSNLEFDLEEGAR